MQQASPLATDPDDNHSENGLNRSGVIDRRKVGGAECGRRTGSCLKRDKGPTRGEPAPVVTTAASLLHFC